MRESALHNQYLHDQNEKSRPHASTHGREWSEEDSYFILENWIMVASSSRDELAIAKILGRTTWSCRARAHQIRVELDICELKKCNSNETIQRFSADDDDWNGEWYR